MGPEGDVLRSVPWALGSIKAKCENLLFLFSLLLSYMWPPSQWRLKTSLNGMIQSNFEVILYKELSYHVYHLLK